MIRAVLGGFLSAVLLPAQDPVAIAHYDTARTGANTTERILNPTNVNASTFGRVGQLPVVGCVVAQPLYVPQVNVAGVGSRNILYVATTANWIYAFDADNFQLYFSRNLGLPVPSAEINPDIGYWDFPNCDGLDEQGPVGVVGTPAVDLDEGAMYLVANISSPPDPPHPARPPDRSLPRRTLPVGHHHLLFKIDLRSGADLTAPARIAGSYQGTVFDSYYQLQRPALLLLQGKIYIAFASHTDARPYSGWMFSYDTSLNQVQVISYSPDRSGAGIWQSGAGPATDLTDIWVTTGNNTEGLVGIDDFADSILKINPDTLEVEAKTSFPEEANTWDYSSDIDLGSARVIPLLGTPYLVAGSKLGDLFVISRADMSLVNRFQVAARQSAGLDWTGIYNGMAVWGNTVFVWPGGGGQTEDAVFSTDVLKSYRIDATGKATLIALGQTDGLGLGYQGANLAISSDGGDAASAIVWAATPVGSSGWLRRGHLSAYAANSTGVFTTLWSDSDTSDGAGIHNFAKMAQPLIANGRVYLPTFSGEVLVYGLYAN